MSEGQKAVDALNKLMEISAKMSDTELDGDQLKDAISERINASEELKQILLKAKNNVGK
tara:strand:- start:1470 stop:1646 length:177 start_codon:yes stop_codon:yes gene_type:complete